MHVLRQQVKQVEEHALFFWLQALPPFVLVAAVETHVAPCAAAAAIVAVDTYPARSHISSSSAADWSLRHAPTSPAADCLLMHAHASSSGPSEAGLACGMLPEPDEPVKVGKVVRRCRCTNVAGQNIQARALLLPPPVLPAAEGSYTVPNVEKGKAQYHQHTPGAVGILLCAD